MSFLGVRRLERGVDHPPHLAPRLKIRAIPLHFLWAFKACYRIKFLLHLPPLALRPAMGFGLPQNIVPFFPICHQLSPSSHFWHLKISFYFLFPSSPGSSPSSRPFQFLNEDLFGHPTWCGRKVMRLATLCTNRQGSCLPLHVAVRLTPAVDSIQV